MMTDSLDKVDSFGEDDLGTLILVNVDDSAVGSISFSDRVASLSTASSPAIHRTASLYVFDANEKGIDSVSGRILLSASSCPLGSDSEDATKSLRWRSALRATPLFGMEPPEVTICNSTPREQLSSNVEGCRNALSRVLASAEQGLSCVPKSSAWTFVGRVLHTARRQARVRTPLSIDDAIDDGRTLEYVFVCYVKTASDVPINDTSQRENGGLRSPMKNENLSATKWMSRSELTVLFRDKLACETLLDHKFRAVATKLLALDESISAKSLDYWTISNLPLDPLLPELILEVDDLRDPPSNVLHGDDSKKQGAYGKVKTHKESLVSQLCRVDEVIAALSFLYISPMRSNLVVENDPDMAFCEEILVAVSRSFAAVIRQLPSEILKDVAIFYLVLRALDTVEDDMEAFESNEIKCKHLKSFHETALGDPTWNMDGVGQGDERRLLQEFPAVHRVYISLSKESQVIISDITERMAAGMAEFVGKDLGQGTIDVTEYNRYCHFVAGLVGEGLSRLFASSSLESGSLAKEIHLSDQMGLFLQKTNIIRDFLEDYVDKRAFWPQSIWKKYSATGELGYFCNVEGDPAVKKAALMCLNELVADALELVPDCLAYMSLLQCTEIFRFCAIPQVMALATLEKLFNNPAVFTGVVKIRKGLACKLMQQSSNISDLHEIFYTFCQRLLIRCQDETVESDNPVVYGRTIAACKKALELTRSKTMVKRQTRALRLTFTISIVLLCSLIWLQSIPLDFIRAALVVVLSLVFWFGPWTAVPTNLKSADILKGRRVV